jgi:hypothetical protein
MIIFPKKINLVKNILNKYIYFVHVNIFIKLGIVYLKFMVFININNVIFVYQLYFFNYEGFGIFLVNRCLLLEICG